MRHQVNDPALTRSEQAQRRCALARKLEEAGDYEVARNAMGDLWQRVGERPLLNGLDQAAAAEVLFCAGLLTGRIGSAQQITGAQETAKDLLTESCTRCEALGLAAKASEAQIEIAHCYWREGAYDEARIMLGDVAKRLDDSDQLKGLALLRSAVIEITANKFDKGFAILNEAAPIVQNCDNQTLMGNFHNTLANTLIHLGNSEQRADYTDRALVEYAAADFHFEQAGHTRYRAAVKNNTGFLLLTLGRFKEAHQQLDGARALFFALKDSAHVAQVDETRARAFLAAGRNSEAERIVRFAVRALEQGGEQALLAEALATYGVALARTGMHAQARVALERAVAVAEQAGNFEGAGVAALTFIEELSEHVSADELRATYERADELLNHSQHVATLARLRRCARRIISGKREKIAGERIHAPRFIYAADATAALLNEAQHIGRTQSTVLLTGETGTGKEVLARLIHEWSGRSGEFVAVNCAALTDSLLESQLFGHCKGSFTDAVADYPGAVRQAARGTLFLDEVGELSLANQSKLLRLLEQGEVHPLGAPAAERVDVRIVAATNRDLKEMVAQNLFREDLFYRLDVFHLEIPPLRARPEDIVALAKHFIEELQMRHNKRITFTPQAITALQALILHGNARELRSLIERTIITAADGAIITRREVEVLALRQTSKAGFANPWAGFCLKEEVQHFEERFIEMALRDAGGKVSVAARLLGFNHHETLNWRLNNRNKNLQPAKKPAKTRKRSIIKEIA